MTQIATTPVSEDGGAPLPAPIRRTYAAGALVMRTFIATPLLLVSALAASACSKHIILRANTVDLNRAQSVYWRCEPGAEACETGDAVRESDWNQSGTVRVPLPQCSGGIAKVLILKANRPENAEVRAVCLEPPTQSCPGGVAPVPDPEGGMMCPEVSSDD